MPAAYVFHGVRFIALDAGAPRFFGFAEFLTGLALMVLAWTIADVSYRFRVRTAPIPLQGITYWVVAAVGILTLLTDLWRAEQWLVPQGRLLTPASWQALLGGLFFLTFLAWAWFAFTLEQRAQQIGQVADIAKPWGHGCAFHCPLGRNPWPNSRHRARKRLRHLAMSEARPTCRRSGMSG